MDLPDLTGYDERTIEQLVHKLCVGFEEATGLLDELSSSASNGEATTELRNNLNEQRAALLQAYQRYFSLAGRHFKLDRKRKKSVDERLGLSHVQVRHNAGLLDSYTSSRTTSSMHYAISTLRPRRRKFRKKRSRMI